MASYYDSATDSSITQSGPAFPPSLGGYKAWTIDPALVSTAMVLPTQRVHYYRVPISETFTATTLTAFFSVNGTTVSAGYLGIYDSSLNKVVETASQTTAWETNGTKAVAITPTVITGGPGAYIYLAMLAVAATGPTALRQGGGTAALVNTGLTNANYRVAIQDGQNTLPSSATFTSNGSLAWMGIS